jgi:hypothetical protein
MHAVSYASVGAGRWKRDDDEDKSPLTTLLPATPKRHKEKTPPESQNEDKSKTYDDDQSVIPDLTPETVEPEPSSGEAANPINLIDEADENTAPIPESYRRLETPEMFAKTNGNFCIE